MEKSDIIKLAIKKGIELYTAGEASTEDITDEMLAFVARRYLKEYGYLPKEWKRYMNKRVHAQELLNKPEQGE